VENRNEKERKRNKTLLIASVISFVGNTIVVFGYFFPLDPLGASIFYAYLALGHILFWLRLPKVADMMSWVRLLRKWVQRLRRPDSEKSETTYKNATRGQTTTSK